MLRKNLAVIPGEVVGRRPMAENPALRDARFARSSGRGPRAEERTKCASRSTGFASALLRRPGMTTSKLDTFAPIPPQAKLERVPVRLNRCVDADAVGSLSP